MADVLDMVDEAAEPQPDSSDRELAVWVDADLVVVALSDAAIEHVDYGVEEIVGLSLAELVHPDDLARGLDAFSNVMAFDGVRPAGTYRLRTGCNTYEAFDVSGESVDDPTGTVILRLSTVGDRRRSEILSTGQLEVLEMAGAGSDMAECMHRVVALCESFVAGTAAIVHLFEDGRLSQVSGSVLAPSIVHRHRRARTDTLPASFLSARQRGLPLVEHGLVTARDWLEVSGAVDEGGWKSCVTCPVVDSTERTVAFIEVLRSIDSRPDNEELTFYSLIARFAGTILDQRKSEQTLFRAAHDDSLTGLGNRRSLVAEISDLARSARSFGVLILDLDRFRWINNNFGHDTGDKVLQVAATRLCSAVEGWATVFRHTGDAFTLVAPDIACREALVERAQSLLEALANPIVVAGSAHRVTASVGVARFLDGRDQSTEDVIVRAEAAMYTVKNEGGDGVRVYSLSAADQTQRRMALASMFLRSLEDHQFRLVYQPLFSFSDGEIIGVETLTRWDHPTLGLVSPDEFVSIAEQSGFFLHLDRWVLTENLRHHQSLRLAGDCDDSFRSWVNLSPRTLEHPDLLALVDSVRLTSRERVGLEITERQGFEALATAATVTTKLRDRGFDIAIDDYGTGQASLLHLAELDVTALKVDRTFIARLDDERFRSIIQHTVQLGHSLGLSVTAEGIETPDQYANAGALGFDTAQGYLMSRPLQPGELSDALHACAIDSPPTEAPGHADRFQSSPDASSWLRRNRSTSAASSSEVGSSISD